MAGNRKAAEARILADLQEISPGCVDVELYKRRFEQMGDKEFDAFMKRLADGTEWLTLTVPNAGKNDLDLERMIKIGDKWGHDFWKQLWIGGDADIPSYLTPNKYFVIKVPVRVASQRIAKKMSIPKTQRVINTLTGQPTGDSKGAGFSSPELRLCIAMGLDKTAVELMKYRGGDLRGWAALNASLNRFGNARQDQLEHFASGVVSTNTVKTLMTSAHLSNTL